MKRLFLVLALCVCLPAVADTFSFSTGTPNGQMAVASRPDANGKIEIEAADDFILSNQTRITSATFTGLLVGGATLANVNSVNVEIYRVFPEDSADPPSGKVPTRANSPSDVAFDSRESALAQLSFTTALLAPTFVADNSVLNGIFPEPNFQTHGEGPVTGQEVLFTITFTTPFTLDADHYFFVPQVGLNTVSSEFYWLSGQRPTTPPFSPDLQMWVRNETLAPDWLRVGTDIVGGSPAPTFNGAFSLNGETVPEPSSIVLLLSGVATLWNRRKHFAK